MKTCCVSIPVERLSTLNFSYFEPKRQKFGHNCQRILLSIQILIQIYLLMSY
jgi:hypothetical protein